MEEPSCFDALCRKTLKRRNVVTREDALLAATSLDEGMNGAKALISWERLVVLCELVEK